MRVMQLMETENRPRMYLICLKEWDERYLSFLRAESLKQSGAQTELCPVIPPEWKGGEYETLLKNGDFCEKIYTYEEAEKLDIRERDMAVFPVVPRELAVKTALCISDTFETRFILSCMEAGSRILFLASGVKKFTGKEPERYRTQILSYYKTIQEYGIEITEEIKAEKKAVGSPAKTLSDTPKCISEKETKRKIITAADLERYVQNGMIVLNPGDQITDVARDRAKFMKITLKRL